jgi:hypothetical protein
MTLNKNLNVSSYFDDFDEDKTPSRIISNHSTAVQARFDTTTNNFEIKSTIWVENILVEGSVVKAATSLI